jgi:hypothetical protein
MMMGWWALEKKFLGDLEESVFGLIMFGGWSS